MATYPPMTGYPPKRGNSFLFFIIYLIFGLYLINYPIKFVVIPTVITSFDKWIIFVGGILIIFGAFNLLKRKY